MIKDFSYHLYFSALSSLTVQEFTDTTKLNSSEIPRLMQLAQNPSLLGSLLLEEAKSIASNQKSDDDINCELHRNVQVNEKKNVP